MLLESTKSEPLSLEIECPHMLRALLYLIMTLEGHRCPLAHPTMGLDLQYILDIAKGTKCSVPLSLVMQSLPYLGWLAFPSIHGALDSCVARLQPVQACCSGQQTSDIGRIAYRAVAAMVHLYWQEELADMWFFHNTTQQRHEKCDEVCYTLFQCHSWTCMIND